MASTTNVVETAQVRLSAEYSSMMRTPNVPCEAIELVNRLLEQDHRDHHIFFRDLNGHNHTAHNLLTSLATGANPTQLRLAFENNKPIMRARPEIDWETVRGFSDEDKFYEKMSQVPQYTNYLMFFTQQIEQKGYRAVVNEYCFSRTRSADALFARLYEGAHHSLIHLGLGVEFDMPMIVAQALAQAASHPSNGIERFLPNCEQEAQKHESEPSKPLVDLIHEVRANETIRHAPRWTDFAFKVRDAIYGRAMNEIVSIASQFRIKPDELERRTAEMIDCCAYMAGAAQRDGKPRKIDFFHMHSVTCSIFLTVLIRQPWISVENKIRLVEGKGRMDLTWYGAVGSPPLNMDYITGYNEPSSADMDWNAIFKGFNEQDDDGHVGKFVRAIKNGEDVSKPFEQGEWADSFPIKGDMWLKVARMCYDSTLDLHQDDKWLNFAGFDEGWAMVADPK